MAAGGRTFADEQRRVALSMAAAVVVTILTFVVALSLDRNAAALPFAGRLQTVLRADVFVVAWLAAAIGNVARLRFFSPDDIAGSGAGEGTQRVRRAVAILQNTAEQTILAVFAHVSLAATLTHITALSVALAGLFVIGRLAFWAGYARGAAGRAFGFALTFYSSVGAMLIAIVSITTGWPG